MVASAEVIHEPEHRIPAYHRHGCKLLPWAHLPKSFMNQNTVFLLITAMAANFYRYIVALPLMAVLFRIEATDRVKSFLFRFIAVPAKWIKTARQ